ncbi:MAG: ArnT family glycosyltransferase [Planctomycetaceae bacterium]
MSTLAGETRLNRHDIVRLTLFCAGLFGLGMINSGEMSWPESVVPQTARTMLGNGDWLIPKRGGAPWLEGVPLAQWLSAGTWWLLGDEGRVWPMRLPSLLCSIATVLLTGALAARWFGRASGLLSGLTLATASHFAGQACRANEFTLLTLLVTAALGMFAHCELQRGELQQSRRHVWPEWIGGRAARWLGLFLLLGATNLAGPLWLGPVCVALPIVGFLLWNWDARRLQRFGWLWGWLAALTVGMLWPLLVAARFPEAWDFWLFDLNVRLAGDEAGFGAAVAKPVWYYAAVLAWVLAPWSLVVPAGFWRTRHEALAERYSPQRFVWCWALFWPLFASLIPGKSPDYLLPSLPAWSILAAFGLQWLRDRIREWPAWSLRPLPLTVVFVLPLTVWLWLARMAIGGRPGAPLWLWLCPPVAAWCVWNLHRLDFRRAAQAMFLSLAILYAVSFIESGLRREPQLRAEAAFLRQVREVVPAKSELFLDMSLGGAKGCWCQLLLGDRAIPLHNPTFLNTVVATGRDVFVVTDGTNRVLLDRQGEVTPMLDSGGPHDPALKLYRLTRTPNAPHTPIANPDISPMQAKYLSLGPYLKPEAQIGKQTQDAWR